MFEFFTGAQGNFNYYNVDSIPHPYLLRLPLSLHYSHLIAHIYLHLLKAHFSLYDATIRGCVRGTLNRGKKNLHFKKCLV